LLPLTFSGLTECKMMIRVAFAKMLTDIVFPRSFELAILDNAGMLLVPETMTSLYVPCEIRSKSKSCFALFALNWP
jgi:hypothetical protein